MPKTDIVVRNAQDLEKKYNFASLLGLKKNVEITAQGIQKIENELNNMLNALVINLKDVLDSQSEISLWFYSGTPTTKNSPYVDWKNPNEHIGDIYYDQSSGRVYQWNGVWEVNTNTDLIEAMAITNSEIDTTEDHERKVFFDTPTVPYSNGDWWIKEDGTLFICQISKKDGKYEEADFINSSNYVESIAEKIGEELKVLKGTITVISENYAKFTDLATGGSTIISGDNIVTGSIKSENYAENTSGMKISLTDGSIDSKYFKTDMEGNMTSTGGTIGGFTIDDEKLYAYITTEYDFNTADVAKIQQYVQGTISLTEEELIKYDINGDGVVDDADKKLCAILCLYSIDSTHPGRVEIDSTDVTGNIKVYNGLGEVTNSIGICGVEASSVDTETLYINGESFWDNFYYKNGDGYIFEASSTEASLWLGGTLTTGSTQIAFTIFVPKSLENINSITCSHMDWTVRSTLGGYATGGNIDISKVEVYKSGNNAVSLVYTLDTAVSTTVSPNNAPVAVCVKSITLGFYE